MHLILKHCQCLSFLLLECDSEYSQNGGTCHVNNGQVTCTCTVGFTGAVQAMYIITLNVYSLV